MAGTELSHGYLMACLNTATQIVAAAVDAGLGESSSDDGTVLSRTIGDSCEGLPPIITSPPVPEPKGGTCVALIDLPDIPHDPTLPVALAGAHELLVLVARFLGTVSPEQVYDIKSLA